MERFVLELKSRQQKLGSQDGKWFVTKEDEDCENKKFLATLNKFYYWVNPKGG